MTSRHVRLRPIPAETSAETFAIDATLVFISTQATVILTFFLSKNIRIARDRVYEQTTISRGKGPEFWQPYVEEWDSPPKPSRSKLTRFAGSAFGRVVIKSA